MNEVAIVPTELEAAKGAVKALKFERDELKAKLLSERRRWIDVGKRSMNKSGCACLIAEDGETVEKLCGAHAHHVEALKRERDTLQAVVEAARLVTEVRCAFEDSGSMRQLREALAAYDKEPTDGD